MDKRNASKKGKPNLMAAAFCSWLNNELLPLVRQHHSSFQLEVSVPTATRWLHKLGFSPTSTKIGIYIDGHERADVVAYRTLYLRKLEILESTHSPHPLVSDESDSLTSGSELKQLVLLYHDESTFIP